MEKMKYLSVFVAGILLAISLIVQPQIIINRNAIMMIGNLLKFDGNGWMRFTAFRYDNNRFTGPPHTPFQSDSFNRVINELRNCINF